FRETLVNLAHLHLLLNHFPTVGTVIGLGLFVGALVTKNDGLKRTSMLVLLLIAVSALPVYFSGNAAFEAIQSRPDVSKQFVARHQDVALLALVLMAITGALAWCGLWQFRRNAYPAIWNVYGILLFSLLTVVLMTVTATMGARRMLNQSRYRHVLLHNNSDAVHAKRCVLLEDRFHAARRD